MKRTEMGWRFNANGKRQRSKIMFKLIPSCNHWRVRLRKLWKADFLQVMTSRGIETDEGPAEGVSGDGKAAKAVYSRPLPLPLINKRPWKRKVETLIWQQIVNLDVYRFLLCTQLPGIYFQKKNSFQKWETIKPGVRGAAGFCEYGINFLVP